MRELLVLDLLGNNAAIECPACSDVYIVSGFMEHKRDARNCPHCQASNGVFFKDAKDAFERQSHGMIEQQVTRQTFDKDWLGRDVWIRFTDSKSGKTYRYPHDQYLHTLIRQCGIIEGSESWDNHGRYSIPHVSGKQKTLLARYEVKE